MKRQLLLGAALISALAIPLALGGRASFGALLQFPAGQLVLMLALVFICSNLNALRLRLLLAGRAGRLAQSDALGVVLATEFAICATPGGSGGPLVLLGLLARRGVRPAQGSAIFAVDQLADLLFFLLALLAVTLYLLGGAPGINITWLIGLAGGLAILFLLLGGLLRHFQPTLRLTGTWLARLGLSRKRRLGVARRLLHFRRALIETLRLPRRTLLAVFTLCALHWLLRYSVLYLAVRGLQGQIDWAWTFLIQMLAMAAGHISVLPGGAGSTELTVAALLTPLVGSHRTAAAIIVWRFATYHFHLLIGAPAFWLLWRKKTRRQAVRAS
ncbi:YbhN family protein [Halomonas sp. HP20-15]|uniref:lysylphosphatidylglycerol synthase transmembrane domain-containing protein n=1 Tax=Halomonas sp. HP20-15 TaxID=3085901 RepID=UPI002980DA91|nr:YbhN family protein [Halomonas sp. HP20-15]MDW5376420.1 YbhN family protein [Halomonas sp. HP20-15]